jgi:hypothetical protein
MLNWKEYGRMRSLLNFEVPFMYFLGGTEVTYEKPVTIIGFRVEIRTLDLRNTNRK